MATPTKAKSGHIIMPSQPGYEPPKGLIANQASNTFGQGQDSHKGSRIGCSPSQDVHHAKLRLLDAFTAFVHSSKAVIFVFIGLVAGVVLTLLITDRAMIVGAETLERGAMIGSVFGEGATKNAPGDPRTLH